METGVWGMGNGAATRALVDFWDVNPPSLESLSMR